MTQITLPTPIVIGETETTEIYLREPTGGDLRGLKIVDVLQGDVDSIATLVPRIATPVITPKHIKDTSMGNIVAIQGALVRFLADTTA